MIALHKATDATGFAKMHSAASAASSSFRDAAASTGMFEVQQLRLNSATDDYVKKLRAQKMSFREMAKQRKISAAAYKEQLALENMSIRQGVGGSRTNKGVYDVIVPKQVSADLDTAGKRLAFMNAELKSGAHQMINWGKNTQWAGRQLMVGFTMPIAAFGAAAAVMAYQVDKELTRIQKVYDAAASANADTTKGQIELEKELAELREDSLRTATAAAKEYGAAATETLQVQAELAATGKTGVELQKSTMEVMRIARLGEVEHQTAIDATIALQSIFRMSNQELTESFNYMNAVENATSLSTADFATAIPIAASAVKEFGGDIQELGILLTAMKENGIPAAEGANALKATMQRLTRPSKQIREEWQALTNTDITKLVSNADNLSGVFSAINDATKNLGDDERRKAFAGLFGSYQVSRMMALTKGMGELEQGVGQVSSAFDISQQSSADWASTAEAEMERYQKSVSGMWDTTFQAMKLEMSEIGEPFLVLATKIVKGVNWILTAFNDLPDWSKVFIAGVIGATALAGGVLMLAGLMGNLAGNVIKGMANLAGFAVKMNIVDRETKAGQLATEMATKSFLEEANAVSLLTTQLNALAAAQMEAAALNRNTISDVIIDGPPTGSAQQTATRDARKQHYFETQQKFARQDKNGNTRYRNIDPDVKDSAGRQKVWMNAEETHKATIDELNEEALAMNERINESRERGVDMEREGAEAAETRGKKIDAVAGFVALEGIAMAAQLQPWSDSVAKAGEMAMYAGLILPAVAAAVPMVKQLAAAMLLVARNSAAGAAGAGGLRGALAVAGRGIVGMLTPWGLAATAVAGIGYGIYKWRQHAEEAREEIRALHRDARSVGDAFAEASGETKKQWDGIVLSMGKAVNLNKQQKLEELYESEPMKKSVDALGDEDLPRDQRDRILNDHYLSRIREYGDSRDEAATHLRALMSAAKMDLAQQEVIIDRINENYGKIKPHNAAQELLKSRISLFSDVDPDDSKESEKAAEAIVTAFGNGFTKGMSELDRNNLMATMGDLMMRDWAFTLTTANEDPAIKDALKKMGINTAGQLADAVRAAGGSEQFQGALLANIDPEAYINPAALSNMVALMDQSAESSSKWTTMIADSDTRLGDAIPQYIDDWQELQDWWAVTTQGLDYKGAVDSANDFATQLYNAVHNPLGDAMEEIPSMVRVTEKSIRSWLESLPADRAKEMALWIHSLAEAQGIDPGTDAAQAYYNILNNIRSSVRETGKWAGEMRQVKSIAGGVLSVLNGFKIPKEVIAQGARDAMAGVQEEIADAERGVLDASIEKRQEENETYWDNQKTALDNRLDREEDALDSAWDGKRKGLEAYWDARIEGIEKAIEAEQKAEEKRVEMFDAEIARINRLAGLANTNIDFNVALNEGNLDEAAKISNDVQAEDAEFVFNRERDRGGEKSEKRIERLEDRKEVVEEQKDAAMEAFDKREERAKEHFAKMREMEEKSLDQRAAADKEAKQKAYEREKKNLEKVLDSFLAFTPKNRKQLEKHMDDLGLDMTAFGEDTLQPMSTDWATYLKDALHKGVADAALAAKSDNMWKELGEGAKNDLISALGFSGPQSWNHFMKTGEMKQFDESPAGPTKKLTPRQADAETRHEGGWIGSGSGSRKGVARTQKGLHSSETMVRAKKNEFMVNDTAAAKHAGLLEAINSGKDLRGHGPAPTGVGGNYGPGGLVAAMTTAMFLQGFKQAMTNKVALATAPPPGGAWSGQAIPTAYGLPGVKPWVLEAANYLGSKYGISSIGGVGDRGNNPTSDHPRGLALDFMTTDVDKGWSLANEALRLQGVLDGTYMIWQKKIHSFDSRGWRDYSHPSGASSPTLDHMDHVHISFSPNGKAGDLPTLGNSTGATGFAGAGPSVKGSGNYYRASAPGKGWGNSHDYNNGKQSPIYAIGDGTVTAGALPPSAGSGQHADAYPRGYGSYGVFAKLNTDAGDNVLYAHLWPGTVQSGRVKGGQPIGLSASTGYSSGYHTHFEVNGSTNAQGAFASMGIPLRKGTEYVKYDNTPALLHKGESVMTKRITEQVRTGAERFANGGDSSYNVVVNINGTDMDSNAIAREVVRAIKRETGRAPQSRAVGR